MTHSSNASGQTTINSQTDPSDVARCKTRYKGDGMRDLVEVANSADRNLSEQRQDFVC